MRERKRERESERETETETERGAWLIDTFLYITPHPNFLCSWWRWLVMSLRWIIALFMYIYFRRGITPVFQNVCSNSGSR